MKTRALFVTLLCYNLLFSQDSVVVTFTGRVIDTARNSNVPFAEIEINSQSQNKKTTSTDSSGFYEISMFVPKGKSNFIFHIEENFHFSTSDACDTFLISDLLIEKNLRLSPRKMCWDSFLPLPIYYAFNQTALSLDSLEIIRVDFQEIQSELNYAFENRNLEISASCDYNEKKRIARKRLRSVYNIALKSGIDKRNMKLTLIGSQSMFVCEYCDGCHYYYLKGKGITLSQAQFKLLTDPVDQERHLHLRRKVELKWVEK